MAAAEPGKEGGGVPEARGAAAPPTRTAEPGPRRARLI